MSKPLFKASEGGWVEILREREDATQSEVEEVSGMCVLIRLKVRLEAFPTGSPMSVWLIFLQC